MCVFLYLCVFVNIGGRWSVERLREFPRDEVSCFSILCFRVPLLFGNFKADLFAYCL